MDFGLEGKVALMAASSQGLGRAAAEELANEGASLIMCSRTASTLESAAQAVRESSGVAVLAVPADLTDPDGVRTVVEAGLAEYGHIDVLVTNTGGPPSGAFVDHSPQVWQEAIAQNLESVLNLTRAVLPGMKERAWGRIINVTSIAVKQPVDGLILSNSVRAAVTGFARTLANEVAALGITVNNVMPGFTRTARLGELADSVASRTGTTPEEVFAGWDEQVPMGRLGEPREFAALVAFLASERASYITGTSIQVDGGWIRSLI